MAEAGILGEDDRVELIEGEVVKMSPLGSLHAACVDRLITLLYPLINKIAIIRVQNPVRLSDFSEPEPDVALLKPRKDFYAEAHPRPSEVFLIIEVSDTSTEYDRNVKRRLYARAGIAEFWLIDLTAEALEIYNDPQNGEYLQKIFKKRGESFQSSAISDLTLEVDQILG
ncbi:MAG: Uma2 family endonuclease [candidate division Zixibacteria bacterium]|nr:Uma2 family endonuclease [candidate division Zixibacteria bacterium]